MTEPIAGSTHKWIHEQMVTVTVEGTEPPIRLPVSHDLLVDLLDWSEPVQVRARHLESGEWTMVFRRVPQDG
jgi:hypothetical protein